MVSLHLSIDSWSTVLNLHAWLGAACAACLRLMVAFEAVKGTDACCNCHAMEVHQRQH
jgi:hypothetical protein